MPRFSCSEGCGSEPVFTIKKSAYLKLRVDTIHECDLNGGMRVKLQHDPNEVLSPGFELWTQGLHPTPATVRGKSES